MAKVEVLHYQPFFSAQVIDETSPQGIFILPEHPDDASCAHLLNLKTTMIRTGPEIDIQVIVKDVDRGGENIVPFSRDQEARDFAQKINDRRQKMTGGKLDTLRRFNR